MAKNEPNGTDAPGDGVRSDTAKDAALLRFISDVWSWGRRLKRPIKRAEFGRRGISKRETDRLEKLGVLKASGNGYLINDDLVEALRK